MARTDILGDRAATREALIARIKTTPMGETTDEMRAGFTEIMEGQIAGEPGEIGGVPGLYVGEGDLKALWFHGGGYVMGAAQTHTYTAEIVAQRMGGRIFLPDYRLAPEHVWPAQLDDAQSVLLATKTPLAVIGDSAGGHLALQLALRHPERITRLALFSPNTDRTGQSDTRRRHTSDDYMNADSDDRRLFEMSCPGLRAKSPDASPILADLCALPPTYVAVGGDEVLLDDSLLLARELGQCGIRMRLDVLPGLWHMFWQWPDVLPQADAALSAAADFIAN